jgi:periplasmic protein TonB
MTEREQRSVALLVSVIIHAALLVIVLPAQVFVITPEKNDIQVPVQFVVKAPEPEPTPPPKPPIPDKVVEKPVPSKPIAKPEPIVPAEPTSLPGDRKVAIVSKSTVPIYPKSALNQGLTGTVITDFAISAEGIPTRFRMIKSSGHKSLDDAFTQTVMTYYTFEPKRVMGENLAGSIRLSYSFELEDTP